MQTNGAGWALWLARNSHGKFQHSSRKVESKSRRFESSGRDGRLSSAITFSWKRSKSVSVALNRQTTAKQPVWLKSERKDRRLKDQLKRSGRRFLRFTRSFWKERGERERKIQIQSQFPVFLFRFASLRNSDWGRDLHSHCWIVPQQAEISNFKLPSKLLGVTQILKYSNI